MPRQRSVDDLSVEELRRLLIEKQRAERQTRLDAFRRTGRALTITAPSARQQELPGLETDRQSTAPYQPVPRRRVILDRVLLVIELAAVLGLAFVIFNGYNLIKTLNQEVAQSLVQPTLTPTPIIMAVVLPSGHTPPDSPGGVQPNEAEIPAHLQPLYQSMAALPTPTPSSQQAIRIQIPAIGVDAPIVIGDSWDQLKKGVAMNVLSPDAGQTGNLILSAHNDVYGEIFRDLDKLKDGDTIVIYSSQHTYTYVFRDSKVVEPSAVEVMAQSQEKLVTLISCYPYMVDKKRIVVTAVLQENP